MARTWTVQDIAPGNHAIEVQAEHDSALPADDVDVTITTVAEERGFTC